MELEDSIPVGVVCSAVALFWKEAGVESVVGSGLASRGVDRSGDEGAGEGKACEWKSGCSRVGAYCMVEEFELGVGVTQDEVLVVGGCDDDVAPN